MYLDRSCISRVLLITLSISNFRVKHALLESVDVDLLVVDLPRQQHLLDILLLLGEFGLVVFFDLVQKLQLVLV